MSRRLQTVAATTCMKLMLLVFNFLFWVAGIAIFTFGLWLKISLNSILELSEDYNEAIPYIFMGVGAFIIIIGFFACSCTIKGQPILLYVLSVFLVLLVLLEIAAAISAYMYRAKIEDGFKATLNNSITAYGNGGLRDRDVDMLQSYLKCCGVNDYNDWLNKWQNSSVPSSCCQVPKDICQYSPFDDLDIYKTGCYVVTVDFINHNLGAICGIAIGLAFFQLLGVVLACYLAKYVDKAKYEPVN